MTVLFNPFSILLFIVGILIGCLIFFLIGIVRVSKSKQEAERIIEEAKKEAKSLRKESVFEAKEEIHSLKAQADKEIKEMKKGVIEQENRLNNREKNIDRRDSNLQKREDSLDEREKSILKRQKTVNEQESKIDELLSQQQVELEKISGYTSNQAKDILFDRVKIDIEQEVTAYIKEQEEIAKVDADKIAKNIIAHAIQRYSSEVTNELTVSVVALPNDDMKGRIIGREGRNIRTLESLTGVDLIIDDTPEAVVLSCFDPVRREIARISLETLISDGRIHPGRIEEIVEKTRRDVDKHIRDLGEETVFELGITKPHPDIIKYIGRLNYRTSYGQNVLKHSKEVAHLAGIIAAELGEDVSLAKRAGLLHDIGKAIDHEVEGSHIDVGIEIAKRHKEHSVVLNAIASHHGEVEPNSVISVVVAACDALSAARPGARSESLQNYLKRIEKLEEITNSFKGVDKSFAIQAGRELRIVVKPDQVDDLASHKLARDVKSRIENEMQYPGTIKVTVIRETRVTEEAK